MRIRLRRAFTILGWCLWISASTQGQTRQQGISQEMPALIPLPQSLQWVQGAFPFTRCEAILINSKSLQGEVVRWLAMTDSHIPVKHGFEKESQYTIQLILGKVTAPFGQNEAYHLVVNNKSIILTANTPHGIFNGLQTLYQLIGKNKIIPGCEITDYPAYPWRGYMVDVGRNYQSPELLKQQIDIMSRYKLNIFHFHLTENVAWRLQIKKYPQLTSPESMTRNQGKFYSVDQMKDLIRYCKDRHITLVPEIDMPGHSEAFTRAMGTNMQSDSGLHIIKDIIREICTTYDIPYIHIGADEVAIKNKQFLPEVTQLIHQYHKQSIGWDPGGNYAENTIRQIWGNRGEEDILKGVRYIDSRDLYLSDMDPEASVVTIFNRQIGKKMHGDSKLWGAEICLWDDRRMAQEEDHLTQNAIYPDILAFGERSWKGGGYPGTVLGIGPDSSTRAKDFLAFEKRLLTHKRAYFKQLPFPYVMQTRLHWKLFGPFENNGDLSASFWPEKQGTTPLDSSADIKATGGTLWLWYHNNATTYDAWLPSPREKTTWYAFTRLWSGSDTTISMWISFKTLLRSLASATPQSGQWDEKQSKIWVNGQLIPPPSWKYPGRNLDDNLELPLVDEGYYYRPPTQVQLKKGWNTFVVKLPLLMPKSLAPWQRRCMFTVIPVHQEKGSINWYADPVHFDPGGISE